MTNTLRLPHESLFLPQIGAENNIARLEIEMTVPICHGAIPSFCPSGRKIVDPHVAAVAFQRGAQREERGVEAGIDLLAAHGAIDEPRRPARLRGDPANRAGSRPPFEPVVEQQDQRPVLRPDLRPHRKNLHVAGRSGA